MKRVMEKLKNGNPAILAFLGDSVTQGCFEISFSREDVLETSYRQRQGYPHKLGEILSYLYPKASVNILNYGVSGETASMGLRRIDEMLSHKPDGVVVCFGLNDAGSGMDGLEAYRENLRSIFERLSKVDVVFMTPNRMAEQADSFLLDERIYHAAEKISRFQKEGIMDAYMECAHRVCAEKAVPLCDCYEIWGKLKENGVDTSHLLSNGINHPTEQMHWMFAIELVRTIMK